MTTEEITTPDATETTPANGVHETTTKRTRNPRAAAAAAIEAEDDADEGEEDGDLAAEQASLFARATAQHRELVQKLERLETAFPSLRPDADATRQIQSRMGRLWGTDKPARKPTLAKTKPAAKPGRLPRRTQADIEAALTKVVAFVKSKGKTGARAEQIREALGLDVREVPGILKAGLSGNRLTRKGRKRACTYYGGRE